MKIGATAGIQAQLATQSQSATRSPDHPVGDQVVPAEPFGELEHPEGDGGGEEQPPDRVARPARGYQSADAREERDHERL